MVSMNSTLAPSSKSVSNHSCVYVYAQQMIKSHIQEHLQVQGNERGKAQSRKRKSEGMCTSSGVRTGTDELSCSIVT